MSDPGQPPARPEKSAAAFRTIGEVAEGLELPAHVLRFWETKFPQIKPVKRAGGRRYYRPEDVRLLRRIRQCLYEDGYTIRGVQRLLEEAPSGFAEERNGPETAIPLPVRTVSNPAPGLSPGPEEADRPPCPPPPSAATEVPARCGADTRAELEEIRRDLLEAKTLLDELLRRLKPS